MSLFRTSHGDGNAVDKLVNAQFLVQIPRFQELLG